MLLPAHVPYNVHGRNKAKATSLSTFFALARFLSITNSPSRPSLYLPRIPSSHLPVGISKFHQSSTTSNQSYFTSRSNPKTSNKPKQIPKMRCKDETPLNPASLRWMHLGSPKPLPQRTHDRAHQSRKIRKAVLSQETTGRPLRLRL
jgi:hypothetical protein